MTFKPALGHNPLLGPAACLCVDCCRVVLDLRCPWRDDEGYQCGDFKGHRGRAHSLLVATTFQIAEERKEPTVVADSGRRAGTVDDRDDEDDGGKGEGQQV
jgi:hypothetical protein